MEEQQKDDFEEEKQFYEKVQVTTYFLKKSGGRFQ